MASTSILALLVALSALAIYSNAAPQAPGQGYPQGGQYPGNGGAPQGPYQGYPPAPYQGYQPQYPGYQQPPQYPGYPSQYPGYQYSQYPGYFPSQYPGYPGPQNSGYNQYHNPDKNVDPLTVPQYGNGERHGSYEEIDLTNKNKTTDKQNIRTGILGIDVANWGYQSEVRTEGGSKHKKSIETW